MRSFRTADTNGIEATRMDTGENMIPCGTVERSTIHYRFRTQMRIHVTGMTSLWLTR
jgi:hypothetical protein